MGPSNVRFFHCDITARLCRWTGILGACVVVPGTEAGLQAPSSDRRSPACLPACEGTGAHPLQRGFLDPRSQGACALPSQKPVLAFGHLGSCTAGLLPRPELCIKRPRKIHPKINMKAKTLCQELQPHTSCWLFSCLSPGSSDSFKPSGSLLP